jgi:hypothetical protein
MRRVGAVSFLKFCHSQKYLCILSKKLIKRLAKADILVEALRFWHRDARSGFHKKDQKNFLFFMKTY